MPPYVAEQLADLVTACEIAASNQDKGESMANLVEYVFRQVPGITRTYRGFIEPDGTAEIDLIFRHNLLLSGFGIPQITLIMECKNEARKISAEQVTRFATKLRNHNQPIGFIISAKGLSGKGSTYAHGEVHSELAQGRTIVILTLHDLRTLTTTEELIALCETRLHELEVWRTYRTI